MKYVACLGLVTLLASSASVSAQTPATYPSMYPIAKYLMATPAQEIALARSAAPKSISADASVLVLGKTGYYTAVKGTNGWTCYVGRSWTSGFDDPQFWNWKLRGPICFNPPAVQTVLPQYEAVTKWVIAGATREQVAAKSKAAYASHQFTDPAPGALSLMLSKEGNLSDPGGPWHPHVMPFVAYDQMVKTWGAGLDGSPIIAGPYLRPYQPAVIFIPVDKWSDGSPARM